MVASEKRRRQRKQRKQETRQENQERIAKACQYMTEKEKWEYLKKEFSIRGLFYRFFKWYESRKK